MRKAFALRHAQSIEQRQNGQRRHTLGRQPRIVESHKRYCDCKRGLRFGTVAFEIHLRQRASLRFEKAGMGVGDNAAIVAVSADFRGNAVRSEKTPGRPRAVSLISLFIHFARRDAPDLGAAVSCKSGLATVICKRTSVAGQRADYIEQDLRLREACRASGSIQGLPASIASTSFCTRSASLAVASRFVLPSRHSLRSSSCAFRLVALGSSGRSRISVNAPPSETAST